MKEGRKWGKGVRLGEEEKEGKNLSQPIRVNQCTISCVGLFTLSGDQGGGTAIIILVNSANIQIFISVYLYISSICALAVVVSLAKN